MAIKVKGNVGGDVTGRNKSDGSELETNKDDKVQELEVGGDVGGDLTGLDKTTNSKKSTFWIWVIRILVGGAIAIAGYYFSQEQPEAQQETEIIENDSIN